MKIFLLLFYRNGANETGIYKIDPDGQLIGNDPITVRCIFFGKDALTNIEHDKNQFGQVRIMKIIKAQVALSYASIITSIA